MASEDRAVSYERPCAGTNNRRERLVRTAFLNHNLVREEKRRSPVIKLNKEHPTVEVVDDAQYFRLLLKPAPTIMIANRPEQTAMLTLNRNCLNVFHGQYGY